MLQMTGTNKDRFFKLASGGIMMALGSSKKGHENMLQGVVKLLGAVFVIYGITGWDPIAKVTKAISKSPVSNFLPAFKDANKTEHSNHTAQGSELASVEG